MGSGILGSIAGKLAGYIIDPVWSRFQHLFSYKSNIQNLRDDLKELEEKKTEVQQLIDASQRNAEVVKPAVFNWLGKLDEVKKESDVVLEGTSNVGMGCFSWFPGLKSRYLLSKKAVKHSAQITKLIANGKFIEVGYIAPPWNMPYKSHEDSEGLESRSILRDQVMEALKNDKKGIIGICGMAGIGKTTLVKEIADKLRDDKLFDEVAMATVSQDPNTKHIQDQLAEELGLTIFPQASMHARAGRLRSRLINADCKKILVILDDIWKELDLHNLGIPALDEAKGLKVLLTSRFPHVCRNMGAKIVEVKALSDQEA